MLERAVSPTFCASRLGPNTLVYGDGRFLAIRFFSFRHGTSRTSRPTSGTGVFARPRRRQVLTMCHVPFLFFGPVAGGLSVDTPSQLFSDPQLALSFAHIRLHDAFLLYLHFGYPIHERWNLVPIQS